MSIKFKARLSPRTEDGGFHKYNDCLKCGAKTTCYLEFHLYTTMFLLCIGCLQEGIDTINDAMIESYKNATRGGNR